MSPIDDPERRLEFIALYQGFIGFEYKVFNRIDTIRQFAARIYNETIVEKSL